MLQTWEKWQSAYKILIGKSLSDDEAWEASEYMGE
jgi:hypothetical protein